MAEGEAIYLAKLQSGDSESVDRFSLSPEMEKHMLSNKRFLQSKVSIISVAGAFRKGKSFLLNFFLRYLRAVSRGNTENWIQSEDKLDDGFHWRAGTDRDTTGILVWSEPFFIRKPNGEEVAVLLMDTQGTFDHQSSQQDCTSIFAFSTLLSSVQIFNISQNILETDLQHLRLFVEFAAMAKNSNENVLQELCFLIRDWQNPDEFENGDEGGRKYLSKVLSADGNMPTENRELRAGIKKYFQKMSCFLLPNPGKNAGRANFRGELDKLDEDFVEEVRKFVEFVLSPENLVKKTVNGVDLTGSDILKFANVYYEVFRSGRLPSPKSIFSATVELANAAAATSSKEMFTNKGQATLSSTSAVDALQLDQELKSLKREALEQFDNCCMQKESHACHECRCKLEEDLEREAQQLKLMNQMRSETIAAKEKTELISQNFERALREQEHVIKRQQQMEQEYQEKIKQITESSVSKEEMKLLLEKESMRRQLDLQESKARNSKLESQIESLLQMNEQLQRQMRESQEERKQQEARTNQMIAQWEQRMADEQKRRRREEEWNAKLESFLMGVFQAASAEIIRGAVSDFFSPSSSVSFVPPMYSYVAPLLMGLPGLPSSIHQTRSSPTPEQDDKKGKEVCEK